MQILNQVREGEKEESNLSENLAEESVAAELEEAPVYPAVSLQKPDGPGERDV